MPTGNGGNGDGGDRRTWYLRRIDLFRGLSDEEIEEIAQQETIVEYGPGDLIIGADTPPGQLFIVKEGTVRLFHRGPDGREVTAGLIGRGRVFGISALFPEAPGSRLSAEAATEVVVCVSNGRKFLQNMLRWPQVALNLVTQLGSELLHSERRLARVVSGTARTRLADALYRLAHEAGEELPGGARLLPAAITRGALGREIGARRETVARLLGALEEEGLVRREGAQIVLTDLDRLARVYGLTEDP